MIQVLIIKIGTLHKLEAFIGATSQNVIKDLRLLMVSLHGYWVNVWQQIINNSDQQWQ
jgi:hypothetical protein